MNGTPRPTKQTRGVEYYDKTIGGTYSAEYRLHVNADTHGTVRKHRDTDDARAACPYCEGGRVSPDTDDGAVREAARQGVEIDDELVRDYYGDDE